MTGDLAVWFRAQLDADEQTAQAATTDLVEMASFALSKPNVAHIARHDPAFTLADITAKRAIIDLHECAPGPIALAGNIDPAGWRESDIPRCDADWSPYPCDTLRLLAQPYAGRPGWHNEWTTT